MDSKLVVGVTGGIGSGKTTAVNLFEKLGASVVDTDAIAHALTQRAGRRSRPSASASALPMCNPTADWTATQCGPACSPIQPPGASSKASCIR